MFSNEAITHAYCSSNLLEEKRYFDVLFISILVYFDKGRCFVWTGFYMIDMIGTSAMKKRNSVMFILTMTVAKAIWNVRVLWMDSKRFNASYISPLVLIILQYLLLLSNLERWVIFFLSHQAGLSLTDVKISNYELKFSFFFLWKHFNGRLLTNGQASIFSIKL